MSDDAATDAFTAHRPLLFSIVYNLAGSVADTEDVLQETWLAWKARSEDTTLRSIDNPRGYLVRVAVNKALALRATIDRRRETYPGTWLPEPVAAEPDGTDPEAVSMAMLVVLETLSPLERAVFVLHEVFGYPHTEIGHILGRSSAAIRQLSHRSRNHVRARRPRYRVESATQRDVTVRFMRASADGDIAALVELLAPGVTFHADGAGRVPRAPMRPVHGRDRVARIFVGPATRPQVGVDTRFVHINGEPSMVLLTDDGPFVVLTLALDDSGLVSDIFAVANPDKLTGLRM